MTIKSEEKKLYGISGFTHNSAQKIKDFLQNIGYETQEIFSKNEEFKKDSIGFSIQGTTITVFYDLKIEGEIYGKGRTILNNLKTTEETLEKAKMSIRLYNSLYSKFRR